MKILRISLENLASLVGRHTVNFTREPLRSAGLFSISGATGSGKSTLLDALCVALYDETPRLSTAGGEMLRDGEAEISQNDPRNLLSRGKGEGLAEVAFISVDGATYTAKWSVRRARGKADKPLQQSEMVLFHGDVASSGGAAGVPAQGGRKREVLRAIEEKIGLSFHQFTRAVLLAQNEFATFLKASDRERAEILQALTGTERFEEISKSVYARCSAARMEVVAVEARLAGQAPMPVEARAAAESMLAGLEAEVAAVKEKVETRAGHLGWFARCAEARRDLEKAAVRHAAALRASEEAQPRRRELREAETAAAEARVLWEAEQGAARDQELAEKRQADAAKADALAQAARQETEQRHATAVRQYDDAATALEAAKPTLQAARDLDHQLAIRTEKLAAATLQRERAEGEWKLAQANAGKLERDRQRAHDTQEKLMAQSALLVPLRPLLPDAQAWLDRLERARKEQEALAAARANFATQAAEGKKAAEALAARRAEEAPLRQVVEADTLALASAEEKVRAVDADQLAASRQAADVARTALREFGEWWREIEEWRANGRQFDLELAQERALEEAETRTLAELEEKQLPAAEAAWAQARRSLERAQAEVAEEAVRLRSALQVGEACPVCGSREHPYAEETPDSAALRALRKEAAEREQECRTLRDRQAQAKAALPHRRTALTEKAQARAMAEARLGLLRGRQHPHALAQAILAEPEEDRATATAARLEEQEQILKALEAAEAARRSNEKAVVTLRRKKDEVVAKLAELERNLAAAEKDGARHQSLHESAAAELARCEQAGQGSVRELEPLWTAWPRARESFARDAQQSRGAVAADFDQLRGLERQSAEGKDRLRELEAALDPARTRVAETEAGVVERKKEEERSRAEHESVSRQRAAIFSGRAATAVEAELADAVRLAGQARERALQASGEAGKQAAATGEALRTAGQALGEIRTRRAEAGTRLEMWLGTFTARTERALDRAGLGALLARDESWFTNERRALRELEHAVSDAAGAQSERKQMLEQLERARPTPEEESVVQADADAQRTVLVSVEARRDAARAQVLADDQRRRESAELAQLLEEKRAAADPWERLNELIGSSDGAKFRGIAQRRSLDVLLGYANVQLTHLSGRYQLERLPESLNLIMLDRDMGDERRSVHSLSGGESFLVSLALALGLASLTSNRVRIESLFIDEGFGSLDPETLNVAMAALTRLEAQGRKVGVISHVTEMTDAIPVQIRVEKGRWGTSRVVAPGGVVEEAPPAESQNELPFILQAEVETVDLPALTAAALAILERERTAGKDKVSARALRKELACSEAAFEALRIALAGKVIPEGRSLKLP